MAYVLGGHIAAAIGCGKSHVSEIDVTSGSSPDGTAPHSTTADGQYLASITNRSASTERLLTPICATTTDQSECADSFGHPKSLSSSIRRSVSAAECSDAFGSSK